MTREEMSKIILLYKQFYPLNENEVAAKAASWSLVFQGVAYKDLKAAIIEYEKANKMGFPPKPGQLLELLPKKQETTDSVSYWVPCTPEKFKAAQAELLAWRDSAKAAT